MMAQHTVGDLIDEHVKNYPRLLALLDAARAYIDCAWNHDDDYHVDHYDEGTRLDELYYAVNDCDDIAPVEDTDG